MDFSIEKIEAMIYTVRGLRVMLDSELAILYEVETKRLNEQVRRNLERFPDDFMFQLTASEYENLRSQYATSSGEHGGRRYQPFVFTENGVAMLSGILSSKQAIQVNITIMRTFTNLRSFLAMEHSLDKRVDKIERGANHLFKVIFERLDGIEEQVSPKLSPNRKKIGLGSDRKD